MTERWRPLRRLWRGEPEVEISDELQFHLEMKVRELVGRGLTEEEAARAARRAFGDRGRIEGELRQIGRRRQQRARRAGAMDVLRTDLLQAWRSFARRPGIPLLVIVLLSLGIGAGTAVFSLVDAVVLNPVAVTRPAALLAVNEGTDGATSGSGFSYPMLGELRRAEQHVDGIAGHLSTSVGVRAGEHAEQVQGSFVTGNYFSVLGVRPQRGRMLQDADEAMPGSTPYVVVSESFWRRALGADPAAIGRTIHVNELALEVVGVAPARFRGTDLSRPVDLWMPVTMIQHVGRGGLWSSPELLETWYFNVIAAVARLRPGSTMEGAVAELRTLYAGALSQVPEQEFVLEARTDRTVVAMPFTEATVARSREDLMRFLWLLAAVVATCLAIACVNVANLMMIRATERTADISVRAALGADRGRLFRQLLLESTVLGLAAGAAGVLVAMGFMRALRPFGLPGGISLEELVLPLDLRVLAFTAGVSILCAIAFGLAPALAGARAGLMGTLRQAAHGRRRVGWAGGSALLGVQVALSLVLLVSAGLLVRSLQAALSVDLGFRTADTAALAVGLEQHGYTPALAGTFVREVLADATSRPGVTGAAAGSHVPIDADAVRFFITPVGAQERRARIATVTVTPGYFRLLGMPLVQGRDFSWSDDVGTERVAIVSESTARALWPDDAAVTGRQIVVMLGEPYRVIGVVRDVHFTSLSNAEAHVYLPVLQAMSLGTISRLHLVAQGSDARAALAGLRGAVRTRDPRLPTFRERDLHAQVEAVLMPQRFGALLLGAFGAIALLISAIGIYAVAAYDVARRRRELGIRAALGASPVLLTRRVLLRSGVATAAGVIAGLALATVATRGLESVVFGVATTEPASYLAAAAVMAAVALVAAWRPARRAGRVDPLSVIREQG